MDKLAIVIPARMASTRFPGKPLVDLGGKPMLQWVYEACRATGLDAPIMVATPDAEIVEAAQSFGAEALLTRSDHPSGTDRIAEVSDVLRAEAYLNVQGDEPLIDPENLRRCAVLMNDVSVEMASLYVLASGEELENPAAVKVVTDVNGHALYFSRALIPYPRNPASCLKKHLGIYAYRSEVLKRFTQWPMSPLESAEGLEQLRFLENGVKIKMVEGMAAETAVDTPEQADQVRRILALRAVNAATT